MYVSRVEVGSLKEIWRTNLNNTDLTGQWLMPGGANMLADGSIAVTNGQYLYKLNGSTGDIETQVSLPTGKNPPADSAYDAMEAFKDGTLVLVSANRAPGCTVQGFEAQLKCPTQVGSFMVAVDPKTLELLSSVQLPELIPGCNTIAQFQGKDYIYLVGTSNLFRYEWNGKNLTLDSSWGPVPYLMKGQTPSTVATPMGDWVVLMTNNMAPSNVSLSVLAISQADPTKIVRINPIPLKPWQKSFLPATLTTDLHNNRIYVWDFGAGKVAAVDSAQDGKMSVAWLQDQRTLGFMPLIGPADRRVLVGTNINPNSTLADFEDVTYTEQVLWRDAPTGKILAQSDYFPAETQDVLLTPGYGGLLYDMLNDGHIMALQPAPGSRCEPEL